MADKAIKPPEGLQSAGKGLWRAILADLGQGWRLDARELLFLERSCRIEDELRELERVIDANGLTIAGSRGQTTIHPALAEARQLRLVQQRLLGAINCATPPRGPGRRAPSTLARRPRPAGGGDLMGRRRLADIAHIADPFGFK